MLPKAIFLFFYSSTGAATGQTLAHVPHEIQAVWSISYLLSPCLMHSTGQDAAHAPQEIHASVILYAMIYFPLSLFFSVCNFF